MPEAVETCIKFLDNDRQTQFRSDLRDLYEYIYEYMSKWSKWTEPFTKFNWANISEPLDAEKVISSSTLFSEMKVPVEFDNDALQTDVSTANEIIFTNINSNSDWLSTSPSDKWVDIFKQADLTELGKVVDALLSFPATNAQCERLFSEMIYIWHKWRSSMTLATVKSLMSIRINFERDCANVLLKLIEDPSLRNAIRDNAKYEQAKLVDDKILTSIMDRMPREDSSSDDDDDDQYVDEDAEPLYEKFLRFLENANNRKNKLFDADDDDYDDNEMDEDIPMDCSDIGQSEIDYLNRHDDDALPNQLETEDQDNSSGSILNIVEKEHDYF